jgi:DNA-binding transcriptional regulator LsrR (DeoR family)
MANAKQAPKKVRIPKAHSATLAAKIRYLDSEKGFTRSEIAATLGIRYQRVRNVLVPRNAKVEVEATELELDPADIGETEPSES